MGEVVGAALVAHVPTIMLPEETRREINDGNEITLVPGLRRMKSECLDRLQPDTVIVFDTHWESTFEHIVTAHERREGRFTSHELPAGHGRHPVRHAGRPEPREGDRRAGRGPGRLLDPRVRRPLSADLLRHGQRLDLPGRPEHALDQRRAESVLHDRGLPAVRSADRRRDRAERSSRGAARVRRHDPPVLPVPGAPDSTRARRRPRTSCTSRATRPTSTCSRCSRRAITPA